MNLILASQSPRRKQLLSSLGYRFIIDPSKSEEIFDITLPIDEALQKVAFEKARETQKRHPEDVILAADTIVLFENVILGKPENNEEAFNTLKQLSGNCHEVKTGIAVLYRDHIALKTVTSTVCFRNLDDADIQAYVRTGLPLDKAGSYGIQEVNFASDVRGSYTNVIGLPLHVTARMLQDVQNDPNVKF